MMAAPSLSSFSSATSHLMRDRAFRRFPSHPPTRFSASCTSAADSHCHSYSYSRSCSGGGTAARGTLYDVLGLAAGATAQEIKAAYRRLARACHPDAAAAGAGREGVSADEFMRVHAAYATLSDPDKRAEYDRRVLASASALGRRSPPQYWPSSSSSSASYYSSPPEASSTFSSGFPRRTWETDQCW